MSSTHVLNPLLQWLAAECRPDLPWPLLTCFRSTGWYAWGCPAAARTGSAASCATRSTSRRASTSAAGMGSATAATAGVPGRGPQAHPNTRVYTLAALALGVTLQGSLISQWRHDRSTPQHPLSPLPALPLHLQYLPHRSAPAGIFPDSARAGTRLPLFSDLRALTQVLRGLVRPRVCAEEGGN